MYYEIAKIPDISVKSIIRPLQRRLVIINN